MSGEPGFVSLWPEELSAYIEKENRDNYLLVDVRQPGEYGAEHLPGALSMPLKELEARGAELSVARDIVFYCADGVRSRAAARFLAETGEFDGSIYNLMGGIEAWGGKVFSDLPKVLIFDKSDTKAERLMIAMDISKGAQSFYRLLMGELTGEPFGGLIEDLAEASVAHAGEVYEYWRRTVRDPLPFSDLFEALKGEILEERENLSDAVGRVKALGGNPCMRLLQMGLDIEYSAYDLYLTMVENEDGEEAREAFAAVARTLKTHMRRLADAIGGCPDIETS